MGYFFHNILIKYDIYNILICARVHNDKIFLIYYYGNNIYEEEVEKFKYKNNKIYFGLNEISLNKIYLEKIKLFVEVKKNIIKCRRKNISCSVEKISGIFCGKKVEGEIYYDMEVYNQLPYKYEKYITLDFDKYKAVFSMNYNFIKKEKMNLFLYLNEKVFCENKFLTKHKKKLNYTLKTPKYIFKIKNELIKINSSTKKHNIKIGEVESIITVNTPFSKPFIKGSKKNMIFLSCTFWKHKN